MRKTRFYFGIFKCLLTHKDKSGPKQETVEVQNGHKVLRSVVAAKVSSYVSFK